MRAMAIDRRTFLTASLGASALAADARLARALDQEPWPTYAACGRTAQGGHVVASFDLDTAKAPKIVALPARGHDITYRPGTQEAVVFARRPGRFAMVFDLEDRKPAVEIPCGPDRHYFGHGVYSADGRLLISTENDIAGERGILGLRDAGAGYAPVGVIETRGVGPHDIALLSDNRTLVVANGGIETDPEGRDALNLAEMRSSLVYIDLITGDVLEEVDLGRELGQLSIRHLAVAANDTVVFGCQWQGPREASPMLVGLHKRQKAPVLLPLDAALHVQMQGYVGSVAVDRSGTIAAASSPKGGLAVYWDIASRRCIGSHPLHDVCGVASAAAPGAFLLSSGDGNLAETSVRPQTVSAHNMVRGQLAWDNHIAIRGG